MNEKVKQSIESLATQLASFIDWSGRAISGLLVIMVFVTFIVVVMRYLFDTGWIALQESISYMHSAVFLLGAAYTLKHNEHVRVDILYARLSHKSRAWIDLLGHILILIPVMLFIIWISYPYIASAWEIKEGSKEAGGLPGVFLLKSLILLMAGLLIVQGIASILSAILVVSGQGKDNKPLSPSEPGASI